MPKPGSGVLYGFALVIVIAVSGYCYDISTVQGTDILETISLKIDSCIVKIENSEQGDARGLLEHASELWDDFRVHHDKVFSGEIEKLEQLPGIFSDISNALGTMFEQLESHEYEEVLMSANRLEALLRQMIDEIAMPVLLDFTGPKCKACKSMKTRLTSIAPDYEGQVRVVFVDANKEKDLIKKCKVMLIPTLIFFDHLGEEVERHIGDMEERTIRAKLDELMTE